MRHTDGRTIFSILVDDVATKRSSLSRSAVRASLLSCFPVVFTILFVKIKYVNGVGKRTINATEVAHRVS